jgi:beta-lactamase class A
MARRYLASLALERPASPRDHLGTSMERLSSAASAITAGFTEAGCEGSLHAVALSSGAEIAVDADRPVVMASVFKPLVALEFYAQAEAGDIDPTTAVELRPDAVTPGPTGLSNFRNLAKVSLRDLAYLMLTISDNAATDALIGAVGLDRVNARAEPCGCIATTLESDLATMLQITATEMGFASYTALVQAQSGAMGEIARARSTALARLDAVAALGANTASRTTARDMTRFLAAVWSDTAASPPACARLREVMAQQVTRRLEPAVPEGGGLAAKSGGLFGRVRNEIGVITDANGEAYAVAIFTRAQRPFSKAAAINAEIGRAAGLAIQALRIGV